MKSDIGALTDAARAQHAEEVQQVKTDPDALARDTQALREAVSASC